MAKRKSNSRIKQTLKLFVPVADRLFSYPVIKSRSIKAANLFIRRYAKFGEVTEAVTPRPYPGPWRFELDTPKITKSTDRKVYVSGWFVPLEPTEKIELRIKKPDDKLAPIEYGIDRSDVAAILRSRHRQKVSDKCGFGAMLSVDIDGPYSIEVKLGSEWQTVARIVLSYDPDTLPRDIYNPSLATNMAEHINLIDVKKRYFYEPAATKSFQYNPALDTKLIAFYLPQFHPFPENDAWWGKGFTEWSNVASSTPRFIGHEQPKLPTDLGFYDLRYEDNIKAQIDLARQHGLTGFCFYYYWFSGQRLLERPLDSFLKHSEWDFNFMICWANENWTRRWDGRSQDVLIAQEDRPEDPLAFIKDVEDILLDPRYIRVDGKPALMVYRAHDLGDTINYAKVWRKYFQENHGTDLHLIAVQSFSAEDPTTYGFDKGLEFTPLSIASTIGKPVPSYNISHKMLDNRYTGAVYDYRKVALTFPDTPTQQPVYRSVMPSWDNDARKKGSGGVFQDANPDLYGRWLDKLIEQSNTNNNIVFINAWNEWAEGAYLEPDTMYGHAYLNRTSQVLAKYSNNPANKRNFPMYGLTRRSHVKLAVIIHLYYDELWPMFAKRLKSIATLDFDLFITIPEKNADRMKVILETHPLAKIIVTPNRGRDVLPFVHLARRLKDIGYEYLLKMHSKKSIHRGDGDVWMKDMLDKLIPSTEKGLAKLIKTLEDPTTGIIGPETHYVSLHAYFGSNKEKLVELLDNIVGSKQTDNIMNNIDSYGFFAGTMFWTRFDAIAPVLDYFYQPSDFESESGQVDATQAHAIERSFSLVPETMNLKFFSADNNTLRPIKYDENASTDYTYATNTLNDK